MSLVLCGGAIAVPTPLDLCTFWRYFFSLRETDILVDESADDIAQAYYVALVVAHEVAHQWFGGKQWRLNRA